MLLFASLGGTETVGELFTYSIKLKTPDILNLGYVSPAANLPLKQMVGKDLCVNIELDGGGKRYISGLVTAARVAGHQGRSVLYELRIEPWLKILTHTSDYKAFQNKNVVDILDEVLDEYPWPVEKRLVENYPTRAWQVQYGETDFDFIQRLMQEWGIYWWFEHSENSHTLVLADAINVHKVCADSPRVSYYQEGLKLDKEFIHTITANESLRSGQWVLNDFDFMKPRSLLKSTVAKGTPLHMYLPGTHGGVWNEQALIGSSVVVLCESLLDAMSFWVAGVRNVTAAYGVNGFTDEMRDAFRAHGVRQVLIAYDNDPAGNEAAVKLASSLAADGIAAFRVLFPAGMDANGYLCQVAEPERAFSVLLDGAVTMGDLADAESIAPQASAEPAHLTSLAAGVAALPAAAAPAPGVSVETLADGELMVALPGERWTLRGVSRKTNAAAMKINAQVLDTESGVVFADSVDMMSARSRSGYARAAAAELGLAEGDLRRSLGKVLLALERQQAAPQPENAAPEMTPEDRDAALELLRDECLAGRIASDMAACGVVGESTNLTAAYLAAVSRKLERPLAVLIQSSSAAGKSSLMDAVLNLIPPEERLQYSAMTGQSLFYLGETNLQHKILAIAEEEGVRQAAYALKLLQSDGELTIASTGKDDASGNLVTKQYTVKGPVMLMLTTTAIDVDEELLNRCLVLTVNESREQTEAIHAAQRYAQTLEGLLAANEKSYITQLHQNAQRLLRPLNVVNPFASQLTFMSDKTRTRRDHMKYLTLIQAIALLHQYQREIKRVEHRGQVVEYIEVERSDIVLANQLAHEILGRTLDEMPPQTRKLLLLIQSMVNERAAAQHCKPGEVRFTRREIRDVTQWSDNQLKVHCMRLAEMEYLLIHGGSRGHLLQYELLWDGSGDGSHLCGLIEPEDSPVYDSGKLGHDAGKLPSGCPEVGAKLGAVKSPASLASTGSDAPQVGADENALFPTDRKVSHRNHSTPKSRPAAV
ncbi:type VI secretion system tip protein VgrG [Escherichia coli]|nr:type VI secretion system tip protein VgrG [Escherichia coli]